MSLSKLIQL